MFLSTHNVNRVLAGSLTMLILCLCVLPMDGSAQAGQVYRRPTPRTSLDDEALRQARLYWNKRFVKCGSSYFAWWKISGNAVISLIEAKDLYIEAAGSVPASPRTQAQILNEQQNPSRVQWSGRSIAKSTVYREMFEGPRSWGRWNDNFSTSFTFSKVNNQWVLPSVDKSITCQDVDSFTLKPGAVPINSPTIANEGGLKFPANYPRWFSLGKGPLTISMNSSGSMPMIRVNRSGCAYYMPHGSACVPHTKGGPRAFAPELEVGVFLAKYGANGRPFQPFLGGNKSQRLDTEEEVFVAINDSDFTDNRGEYRFVLSERGSTTKVELTHQDDWSRDKPRSWMVTLSKSDGWLNTGIPVKANQWIHVGVKPSGNLQGERDYLLSLGDQLMVPTPKGQGSGSISFYVRDNTQDGDGWTVQPNWTDTVYLRVTTESAQNELKIQIGVRDLRYSNPRIIEQPIMRARQKIPVGRQLIRQVEAALKEKGYSHLKVTMDIDHDLLVVQGKVPTGSRQVVSRIITDIAQGFRDELVEYDPEPIPAFTGRLKTVQDLNAYVSFSVPESWQVTANSNERKSVWVRSEQLASPEGILVMLYPIETTFSDFADGFISRRNAQAGYKVIDDTFPFRVPNRDRSRSFSGIFQTENETPRRHYIYLTEVRDKVVVVSVMVPEDKLSSYRSTIAQLLSSIAFKD